jgi:hypothetical protein
MTLRLPDLTLEEKMALPHLVRSRTAATRLVERARMVWSAARGERLSAIAGRLGFDVRTVRTRLCRFHAEGLAGLPFHSWTLDWLQAYLNEERGNPMKRSRIDELILAGGLRWRSQES